MIESETIETEPIELEMRMTILTETIIAEMRETIMICFNHQSPSHKFLLALLSPPFPFPLSSYFVGRSQLYAVVREQILYPIPNFPVVIGRT